MAGKSETVVRVDFSLKREVFFVVLGAILGAIAMVAPIAFLDVGRGAPYYMTWMAFGHVIGVDTSSFSSSIAGISIHMLTAISIGTIVGVFLYKSGILNISKLSNGLLYGIFSGTVVFLVFFIPVYLYVLAPEISHTMNSINQHTNYLDTEYKSQQYPSENSIVLVMLVWLMIHLVFGVILGLVSSTLSIRFGSRYRCSKCDISFSRIDSLQKHMELVHKLKHLQQTRVLILGGGFGGIQVLRHLQKAFQDDVSVDITLVSKDNFFLFTPMLPEVSSGMIETRHILTPVRTFCNRARFYESNVDSIDLKNRHVVISHQIGGKQSNPFNSCNHTLEYDYIVLALGGKTNFFGLGDVAKYSFTIKSIGDAIVLRNHIISMLEQADIEHEDVILRDSLMTFVIVGGGFSGVEIAGELNDFVRESIEHFYHNLDSMNVRVILVNSGTRVLPEVTNDLSEFALQHLRKNGIEVMLNTRLVGAGPDIVKLNDGSLIASNTLIWAGGASTDDLVKKLVCNHDKSGKIIANKFLEIEGYNNAFVIGDCACIIDSHTGNPYPPTAQHAIREAKVAAQNLRFAINGKSSSKRMFNYKTEGMMALIGKRNGIGILFGHKIHGFAAWWLWRLYYLGNLPSIEKRLRVSVDWFIDLFFKRDVTRIKTYFGEENLL